MGWGDRFPTVYIIHQSHLQDPSSRCKRGQVSSSRYTSGKIPHRRSILGKHASAIPKQGNATSIHPCSLQKLDQSRAAELSETAESKKIRTHRCVGSGWVGAEGTEPVERVQHISQTRRPQGSRHSHFLHNNTQHTHTHTQHYTPCLWALISPIFEDFLFRVCWSRCVNLPNRGSVLDSLHRYAPFEAAFASPFLTCFCCKSWDDVDLGVNISQFVDLSAAALMMLRSL